MPGDTVQTGLQQMNSKQLILHMFRGEAVDRVGFFEQTIACSVASNILGRPAFTGGMGLQYHHACAWWEGDEANEAFVQQVRQDTVAIADVLGFDLIRPREDLLTQRPTGRIDEYTFSFDDDTNADEKVMTFDPGAETWGPGNQPRRAFDLGGQVERMERELKDLTDDALDAEASSLDWFVKTQGHLRAVTNATGFIMIPLEEPWLVACIEAPALVERYLDCITERALRKLPFVKKHGADVIWAGGDFADNRGPIYGPQVFKKMVLPRLKRIVEKCHELELPYVFRTDGKLWSIANELFVESGIDGYGEIDVEAGMDLGELRQRYPRLVLCGNVSCSKVLQFGSVDDVVRATRDCIDKARGGGHIVGSSNSLVHGTPAANVFAMMRTAREYGELS